MSNASTVGWMPEPQGRGTMGLVWSCLATIFICTWSALHLHVPAQGTDRLTRILTQGCYIMIGLFAPEGLTYLALCDLEQTLRIKRRCSMWSLKRCFFLNLGGFLVHAKDTGPRTVDPLYLLELFEEGTLPWPEFDDDDIDDRTQGDTVVKIIALSQLLWFIAQLLGRVIDNSAVTTLELFTLSNVFCSVVTYIVWWEKPYIVRCPIILQTGSSDLESFELHHQWNLFDNLEDEGQSIKTTMVAICVALSFGAIHLLGWGFQFPSDVERLLWRICSVGVTTLSITFPLWTYILDIGNSQPRRQITRRIQEMVWFRVFRKMSLGKVLLTTFTSLYAIFRFYMVVEMFVGLRDVPASVYKTTQWSQYFPALG